MLVLRLRERNLGQHIRQLESLIQECDGVRRCGGEPPIPRNDGYHALAQRGHLVQSCSTARTLTGSLDGKRAANAAGTDGITDGDMNAGREDNAGMDRRRRRSPAREDDWTADAVVRHGGRRMRADEDVDEEFEDIEHGRHRTR